VASSSPHSTTYRHDTPSPCTRHSTRRAFAWARAISVNPHGPQR
jgi:hypothetical protein